MQPPPATPRKSRNLDIAVICVLGLLLSGIVAFIHRNRGSDFNQFYSAAKLAGSGHLYDWDNLSQEQAALRYTPVPFGRLPVYAAAFKVFSALPYRVAQFLWMAANLAALAAFLLLWRFPGGQRATAAEVICWSFPAAILISTGQDTAMFLLSATAGVHLLRSNRGFLAGVAFALCANKFHLAVPVPVFLAARRNWSALWGGACGTALLLGLSFVTEGREWPERLLALSRRPEFSPVSFKMPNLNGLTSWIPFGPVLEIALALLVLAAVWAIAERSSLEVAAAAMLAAGLLVSHHAYVYDAILLVPLLLLARQPRFPRAFRIWSFLLCIPVPYALLLEDSTSLAAQAVITTFSVAILWYLTCRNAGAAAPSGSSPVAHARLARADRAGN